MAGRCLIATVAWLTLRLSCAPLVAWRLDLRVEGVEHVPASGPVVLVCRHVHHFYDGCLLLALTPRPIHMLVALDWVQSGWARLLMKRLCAAARWPVVLRRDGPGLRSSSRATNGVAQHGSKRHGRRGAFELHDVTPSLRRALREATALLADGRALVVFPEGYPSVDPKATPKPGLDTWIAFRPGFAALVERVQKERHVSIAVVPVGLRYRRGRRWQVILRYGQALRFPVGTDRAAIVRAVEQRVRTLSIP